MKLLSLFSIGPGCIVLPFLDGDESHSIHVNKEISYIIQEFDFQVYDNSYIDDTWRHHGATYKRKQTEAEVYDMKNKYIGCYARHMDSIVYSSRQVEWFPDDWFSRCLTFEGVTYLVNNSSLWIYTRDGMKGPYYITMNGSLKVVKSVLISERDIADYLVEEREYKKAYMSLHEIYLLYRSEEMYPQDPTVFESVKEEYILEALSTRSRFITLIDRLENIWKTHFNDNLYDKIKNEIRHYIPDTCTEDNVEYYKTLFGIFLDYENNQSIVPGISEPVKEKLLNCIINKF